MWATALSPPSTSYGALPQCSSNRQPTAHRWRGGNGARRRAGPCRRQALQVHAALFDPPPFDPAKLRVRYLSGALPACLTTPRCYTLTHNDVTGALTLSIGPSYNRSQLSGWYTRILRDEILAEWRAGAAATTAAVPWDKAGGAAAAGPLVSFDGLGSLDLDAAAPGSSSEQGSSGCSSSGQGSGSSSGSWDGGPGGGGRGGGNGVGATVVGATVVPASQLSLHIYCHVSGEEMWPAPPRLRSFIFQREMGLVLDTITHAEAALLAAHPVLAAAPVLVHLRSDIPALDRVVEWGRLGQRATWLRSSSSMLGSLFGWEEGGSQDWASGGSGWSLLASVFGSMSSSADEEDAGMSDGSPGAAAGATSSASSAGNDASDGKRWTPPQQLEQQVEQRRSRPSVAGGVDASTSTDSSAGGASSTSSTSSSMRRSALALTAAAAAVPAVQRQRAADLGGPGARGSMDALPSLPSLQALKKKTK